MKGANQIQIQGQEGRIFDYNGARALEKMRGYELGKKD